MQNLIEQIQSNDEALESLKERYYNTLNGSYWTYYKTEEERVEELMWITKIEKRVLRMRHRLFENLSLEASKELHIINTEIRQLNLKSA